MKQNEIEKTPISIVKGIEQKTKGKPNYVIVHNFTETFDNLMSELSNFVYNCNWSPEEDEILRKYYPEGGAESCIEVGVNRTSQAIKMRAGRLGLFYDKYMWSKEELDILKRYYIQGGSKLCQEKGLKRSSRAITSKASQIGLHIKTDEWSDFELNILKQYYPIGGVDLCIEKGIVNRGRKAIVQQANKMNLVVRILWSPIEEKIIKEYYQIGGYKLCQEKGLQHRSKSQITNKAFLLGINKVKKNEGWSKKELDLLSKYYPLGGVRLCIEKGLNRSLSSIRCKANKEGLKYIDNV